VFDEGHLTDGQGRRVDFRNTIIIMTSNLGSQSISASNTHEQNTNVVMEAVRSHFPPEFLNRLDSIVPFRPLSMNEMPKIVEIQMKGVEKLLSEQRVSIKINSTAKSWLAENGFDPALGARPLKRVIYQHVLNPLAREILQGKIREEDEVTIDVQKEKGLEIGLKSIVKHKKRDATPIQPIIDIEDAIAEESDKEEGEKIHGKHGGKKQVAARG